MLAFLDSVRGITFGTVILKMALAFVLGSLIGVERSYKNRPAGFRTHILVMLGATMASMTGIYLYLNAGLPADISRIGAAVVSGLGFLGAGTIIVTKNYTFKGLTTAAGLWASGIIGLALGAGFYEGAVVTTFLLLTAEISLGRVSEKVRHDPEFRIEVDFQEKPVLDRVLRFCKDKKTAITNLQVITAVRQEGSCYCGYITLRPRGKLNRDELFSAIRAFEGILDLQEVELREE